MSTPLDLETSAAVSTVLAVPFFHDLHCSVRPVISLHATGHELSSSLSGRTDYARQMQALLLVQQLICQQELHLMQFMQSVSSWQASPSFDQWSTSLSMLCYCAGAGATASGMLLRHASSHGACAQLLAQAGGLHQHVSIAA